MRSCSGGTSPAASERRSHSRHSVRGEPRGPYCGIGACFDCLVTIDGVGNRRACMEEVAQGMSIETQGAKREITR